MVCDGVLADRHVMSPRAIVTSSVTQQRLGKPGIMINKNEGPCLVTSYRSMSIMLGTSPDLRPNAFADRSVIIVWQWAGNWLVI
jgi:hypothetical protein